MADRSFGLPLALIWLIRKFGLYVHPAKQGIGGGQCVAILTITVSTDK